MFSALLLGSLVVFGTVSCSLKKARRAENSVARVGEAVLTEAQLRRMLPQGLLSGDSAEVAERKVSAWVSHQVLLQKAQANLDELTYRRIEEQIEDYREALVIFHYEEQITRQLLDTVVSEEEIEAYYNANKGQFVLKSNIVRLLFVKVPRTEKKQAELKRRLFSDALIEDGDALLKYADLCSRYAENYFLDGEQWLYFNDVLREVPIKTYNQEEFLKNHRNIEVEAGEYVYYVRILDFKIRDMFSPLSFEKDRISALILNQRKKSLLDKMEMDLMEEAERGGLVQYYGETEYEKDSI